MAVTVPDTLPRPRWPAEPPDVGRAWVDYDVVADELVVYFGGQPVPSYSDPIDDPDGSDLALLVGLEGDWVGTGAVVGLQVIPLLVGGVQRHPRWAILAWGSLSGYDDEPIYREALAAFIAEAEELFDRYWAPAPPIDEQLARLRRADHSQDVGSGPPIVSAAETA